jgi:hypothetical protein
MKADDMHTHTVPDLTRRRQLLSLPLVLLLPTLGRAQPAPLLGQVPGFSSAPLGPGPAPGWEHQTLPKVKQANSFAIVADGAQHVLQITSSASASSWITRLNIDAQRQPLLGWRWKVSRSLPGSSLKEKAGDDYAARLYVLFDLPLSRLSALDRLRISAAEAISGSEIPTASICYVWGNQQPVGSHGPNPYTDRVQMVVADSGDAQAGQWRSHQVDLAQDWATAFGGEMPPVKGIAVSADTDNTGDQVQAWFGDIRLDARA